MCYNITLAARLRHIIENKGLDQSVHVYHFHDWCAEQLRQYHVEFPKAEDGSAYLEKLVHATAKAVEAGRIPRAQYDAVMVDEGHDFEPEWLKLAVQMVNPETNSFLLLYDDAQSIYGKKGLKFSLSSVGIKAQVRTTILRLNYRNTDEIAHCAHAFSRLHMSARQADDDHIPNLELHSSGRHGPLPATRLLRSFAEEAGYIARFVKKMYAEKGLAWSDICITCYRRWMGKEIQKSLERQGVPAVSLIDAREKKSFDPADETVKIMTMHSSKGLEFPCVVVSGVGRMPDPNLDVESEAKLLYVAMTRATEYLLVTADRRSSFFDELERGIREGCPP